MNHHKSGVHARYTEAEWESYAKEIKKVEQAMLQTCPSVWNALKPLNSPPIVGDDPIIEPEKKVRRPGRPRKIS